MGSTHARPHWHMESHEWQGKQVSRRGHLAATAKADVLLGVPVPAPKPAQSTADNGRFKIRPAGDSPRRRGIFSWDAGAVEDLLLSATPIIRSFGVEHTCTCRPTEGGIHITHTRMHTRSSLLIRSSCHFAPFASLASDRQNIPTVM